VQRLNADPGTDFLYTDHDIPDPLGRRVRPSFRLDWSLDAWVHAPGRSRCGLNAVGPRRSPRCTTCSPRLAPTAALSRVWS
jgi:hypothetical protein